MNEALKVDNGNITIKLSLVLLVMFFICLLQFSFRVGGTGVTANYFYLFFPFIFLLLGIKRRLVIREEMMIVILLYVAIYIIGSPIEILDANATQASLFRRFASFLAFLFPLTMAFIEFKESDIHLFKMAVILACLYYGLSKIILFISLMIGVDTYNLKGIVGSQRYGFILALGFFITVYESRLFSTKLLRMQKIVILTVLSMALILTFSRATVVAMFGAFAYMFWLKYRALEDVSESHKGMNKKLKAILWVLFAVALIYLVFYFYGDYGVLRYYKERFIQPFRMDSVSAFTNPASSEGFRFHLISRVLEYISIHPISGSGYQGLYLLYEEFKGAASAHNQYMDVLLRTGIIGGIIWLYLLFRIFRFCKKDKGLLIGFVAILIYGSVHETFKLSYASFVFGMLLSFSYINVKRNTVVLNLDFKKIGK